MTTLTDWPSHPAVRERFGLLAQAAELVASPQIRHQGTLGGNVSQDARCWYYRSGWPCYRAGGNICYADTPTAINREHAILQADRCVAVSPSDTAPRADRARRADDHSAAQRRTRGGGRRLLSRARRRHHTRMTVLAARGAPDQRFGSHREGGGRELLLRESA